MTESSTGNTVDPPKRRVFTRTVIALGFVSLLTDAASDMVWPLLTVFFETHLHASIAFVGVIEGVAEGVSAVWKYGAGRLSDRVSRRKPLVLLGYGLSSLVRPILAIAAAPWTVFFVRITDRIGKGLRTAPRDAMLALEARDRNRSAVFGFHRAMDNAGAVLGPLIAFAILAARPDALRTVFALSAIPGLLTVLTIVFFVRERAPAEPTNAPSGATAGSTAGTASATAGVAAPTVERPHLPGSLRYYLFVCGVFALASASDFFLLAKAREVGLPIAALPLVWAGLSLLRALVAAPGGWLADRMGKRTALRIGWSVYALSYFAFGLARTPAAFLACVLLYSLYYGLTEGAERALVASFSPPGLLGRAYGLFALVIGLGTMISSAAFGWIYRTSSPRYAFWLCAAFSALAAVLVPRAAAIRQDDRAGPTTSPPREKTA